MIISEKNTPSLFKKLVKFLFYPWYFLLSFLFELDYGLAKRILGVFFTVFFLFPLWLIEFGAVIIIARFVLQFAGLAYVPVPVRGASMLPTLPTDGYVGFRRIPPLDQLKPKIEKGDLVVFENEKTDQELMEEGKEPAGFVKRVVAIAGDVVETRDGFLYVNGQLMTEPYTLKPRSTFGSTDFLPDCQPLLVPIGQVFVLGDNRKISLDSRHIGPVSLNDIQFFRKFSEQKEFATRWRDASHDKDTALSSFFSVEQYLTLLNRERQKAGFSPLRHQPKLDASARRRAEAMLKYNDLSFEATKSAYPMKKALADVSYSNIVYGEFPILGYYDAQELYQSFFEHTKTRNFLLNKDYQEIGISTFVGDLNNCPVQIVVQHLAGYVPPNYQEDVVKSWEQLVVRLREVQPSWRRLVENKEFYEKNKEKIDQMNNLIEERLRRAEVIVKRMQANEWLTDEEKQYVEEDNKLDQEQQQLAKEINNLISQNNN